MAFKVGDRVYDKSLSVEKDAGEWDAGTVVNTTAPGGELDGRVEVRWDRSRDSYWEHVDVLAPMTTALENAHRAVLALDAAADRAARKRG